MKFLVGSSLALAGLVAVRGASYNVCEMTKCVCLPYTLTAHHRFKLVRGANLYSTLNTLYVAVMCMWIDPQLTQHPSHPLDSSARRLCGLHLLE